jgi:hypothetical protein
MEQGRGDARVDVLWIDVTHPHVLGGHVLSNEIASVSQDGVAANLNPRSDLLFQGWFDEYEKTPFFFPNAVPDSLGHLDCRREKLAPKDAAQ